MRSNLTALLFFGKQKLVDFYNPAFRRFYITELNACELVVKTFGDDFHVFYSETDVGPITKRLYEELTGIQFGDVEAPEGWIVKVD